MHQSNKCERAKLSEEVIKHESSFWAMVLERLFNITLLLTENCLPFRGHRESLDSDYNGNFLSQVIFLSKYDDIMKQVVTKPKGSTKYLSPQIQNEIIGCLGSHLEKKICFDISSSLFFSLIVDTTQDITKIDQLSFTLRYVHLLRNDELLATSFEIKETFLEFFEVKDHGAEGMTNKIISILEEKNIDLKKCRGQGYDGANVMSDVYNGVQTRLKQLQPKASYVHCASHNLNLVINDAVAGCREVDNFFVTLQELYAFFGNSIKRWDLLSNFSGESEITLKKLNPTRWSSRINSLVAVKTRFFDIVKALSNISLKSNKRDEQLESLRLKNKMTTFEFVFISVIMFNVLTEVNYASKILQKKTIVFLDASKLLQRASLKISSYRLQYSGFKKEAEDMCKTWGISPNFTNKRPRKYKRHFDEISDGYVFENSEENFKVNVFYRTVDIVQTQLHERFISFNSLSNLFAFLTPKNMLTNSDEEILKSAQKLVETYPEDISPHFPSQLINVKYFIKNDINEETSMEEFANFLIIKYNFMESDFAEVTTAVLLLLTLPVTVATAERSFSKLKIIKNYLRNSMTQDRLHDLSLLAIESNIAKKMDLKGLIRDFANQKARKVCF